MSRNHNWLIAILVLSMALIKAYFQVFPATKPNSAHYARSSIQGNMAPDVVGEDEIQAFFRAVETRDFPGMAAMGEKAFRRGRRVENAEKILAGCKTNSFPPFTVYAPYVESFSDKTRRVLLTLDGDDLVESFLAEEMAIVK